MSASPRAALLAALLALSACGSPATRFYTLAPDAAVAPDAAPGPQIEVARIMLPASLDRLSYVAQSGPGQLAISGRDRWAEPLDGMIRRVLAADLSALLPGRVLMPGDAAPPGPVRSLRVNIRRFMASAGGPVVLEADWSLLRNESGPVLRHGRETVTEPVASDQARDAVGGMSAALASFSSRIALAL